MAASGLISHFSFNQRSSLHLPCFVHLYSQRLAFYYYYFICQEQCILITFRWQQLKTHSNIKSRSRFNFILINDALNVVEKDRWLLDFFKLRDTLKPVTGPSIVLTWTTNGLLGLLNISLLVKDVFQLVFYSQTPCASLQWSSVGRDVRRSVLQPVDSAVCEEQTLRLRLRRYAQPLPVEPLHPTVLHAASLQTEHHCTWFFSCVFVSGGVDLGFSSGWLRFGNPHWGTGTIWILLYFGGLLK